MQSQNWASQTLQHQSDLLSLRRSAKHQTVRRRWEAGLWQSLDDFARQKYVFRVLSDELCNLCPRVWKLIPLIFHKILLAGGAETFQIGYLSKNPFPGLQEAYENSNGCQKGAFLKQKLNNLCSNRWNSKKNDNQNENETKWENRKEFF